MGWLWGSSNSNEDAVKNLDPSLKEVLNQSTSKSKPTQSPPPSDKPSYLSQLQRDEPFRNPDPQERVTAGQASSTSAPPTQFPDGRYSELWKNYKPLAQLEAETKNDSDRLSDITEAHRERQGRLGEAVQENCVFEHLAQRDCYRNGSLAKRMTLCHDESKTLTRCLDLNSKFLKALGYLSVDSADTELADRIQAHGDELYRRMMEQEKITEEAKNEGKEPPQFPPMMSNRNVAAAMGLDSEDAGLSPMQKEIKRTLAGVGGQTRKGYLDRIDKQSTPEERELELRLIESEIANKRAETNAYLHVYEQERTERHARRDKGKETVGDRIKRWWGWD